MTFQRFRKEVEKLVGDNYAKFLEIPKEGIGVGDLAIPCFLPAKNAGKNPAEMARLLEMDLANKIRKNSLIREVKSLGPYVNFYINETNFVPLVLKEIAVKKNRYGSSKIGKNNLIIIDCSSPNISKPMSVGHLRSTILGQALNNIHKFLGYKTISDNHLGDWGTQFGNLLYAYVTWGDEAEVRKNPMPELLKLYVKFHEEAEKDKEIEQCGRDWFTKLEKGDKKAAKLWKLFYGWSMKEFKRTYKRLGVKFDYQLGESFFIRMAKEVIKEALEKGVAKKESDAVIIPMNGTPLLIQKSDESTLYAARDIATVKYRMKKRPKKILYVVGSEQKLYFKQVFFAAQRLGYLKDEGVHVDFGLVSLPEGRMSTRAGRIIFLEDLINETAKFALQTIEEKNPDLEGKENIAEIVALGAIKYNDLSRDRTKNIIFDWKEALSFEGDTGPYLQYTVVRANSVLQKTKKKPSLKNTNQLREKNEIGIIKTLSQFPDVVGSSLNEYKPHHIANYLNRLASEFNEYYHTTKIIGSQQEIQRLSLVFSVATVIKTGLALLGIDVPEKM